MDKKDTFEFRVTQDGSVGLYNFDVDDIYHSSYGAKSEAIEKFVRPLNFKKNFYEKKSVKVLDICYGIGYNTKAFLDLIRKINFKGKIFVDALEYDKKLVEISPFIKDGFYKFAPTISYILLSELVKQNLYSIESLNILFDKKNSKYFEKDYLDYILKKINYRYSHNQTSDLNRFLHNIYYHCISQRIKRRHKHLKIGNININYHIRDARQSIKKLSAGYDIVFLDAFTPAKLPTLWTYDFFLRLHDLVNTDSILLTYSNSAAVRHAMLDAGFYVGKLFDKNHRNCGTVASKNIKLIENQLDEYDLGLLSTNAGVYFRDINLDASSFEILQEHSMRKQELNLVSSSSYIKSFKRH